MRGCTRGYKPGEFGSCGQIHPSAGPINVAFDSAYRKGEGGGDFTVGQALSDEGGDLAFAISQRQRYGHRLSRRGDGPALVDQVGGSTAGSQGRAAPILAMKFERGVSDGVGGGDPVTHRLEIA